MHNQHPFGNLGKTFPAGTPFEQIMKEIGGHANPEPPQGPLTDLLDILSGGKLKAGIEKAKAEVKAITEFSHNLYASIPVEFRSQVQVNMVQSVDREHFEHVVTVAFIGAIQERIGYENFIEEWERKGQALVDAHYGADFVALLKRMPAGAGMGILNAANLAAVQKEMTGGIMGMATAFFHVTRAKQTPDFNPGKLAGYLFKCHLMSQRAGSLVVDPISNSPRLMMERLTEVHHVHYVPADSAGMTEAFKRGVQNVSQMTW